MNEAIVNEQMADDHNSKSIMVLALYAGEILLKNGGETYRVEDTISHICRSGNHEYVEAFVIPTGIFVSIDQKHDAGNMVTFIKRIKTRTINLEKVSQVNDLSRRFVAGSLTVTQAMEELKTIDRAKGYPFWQKAIVGGLGSAFFSVLFGANLVEFLLAFIASITVNNVTTNMDRAGFPVFISYLAGGVTAAVLAVLAANLLPMVEVDKVIVGGVLVLVPGVAVVNAIRDSIAGDLISGLTKGAEALIIATSIALGVGTILKLWIMVTGGMGL